MTAAEFRAIRDYCIASQRWEAAVLTKAPASTVQEFERLESEAYAKLPDTCKKAIQCPNPS